MQLVDNSGSLLMGHRIFINHRRDDEPDSTARLVEHIGPKFADAMFFDATGIGRGEDYLEVMRKKLAECDVMLAVIGRNWLTLSGSNGRRLDETNDPVRFEIKTALESGKQIIPVLVNGAGMPTAAELPADIRKFHYKNGIKLASEHYKACIDTLVRDVRSAMKAATDDRAAATESSKLGASEAAVTQSRRDILGLLVPEPAQGEPVGPEHMRLIHSCWRRADLDAKFQGMRMWQIHIMIAAMPSVLARISSVDYTLDKTYPNHRRVNTDPSQFFGFYELANGHSTVVAEVHVAGQPTAVSLSRFISMSDSGPNLKPLGRCRPMQMAPAGNRRRHTLQSGRTINTDRYPPCRGHQP